MKKMKKTIMITCSIILIFVLIVSSMAVLFAASPAPGSEEDPVVTKSYVDGQIAGLAGEREVYVPVEVKAGQRLLGGEGAEIILRIGEAKAIGNADNGISDLTGGQDLMTDASIERNHLLLVPRNDGRGIAAVSDGWLMVRGSYTLEE
ncbi:MAG: hypothetical protein LBT34_04060 [Clostridiales Family XIII bacterium]|jgi:hypothetical protein|nr:hypothetical protein [Clostridiales Family XIII bacterium]